MSKEEVKRRVRENRAKPSNNGEAAEPPATNGHCDDPNKRIYTAAQLSELKLPPPTVIIPDLLVEGLTLFVGKPKAGKSFIALDLAIAVASGRPALNSRPVLTGDVLYVAAEDNWRRLGARLEKSLRGFSPPHRFFLKTEWPRFDNGGYADLVEWLTDHPEARLVIFDTLAKVRPARKSSQSAYEGDYEALGQIQSLAVERHVSIIMVHHTRKIASVDDIFDDVSGTQALMGCADSTLIMRRQRGDSVATLFTTGRELAEKEYALEFNRETFSWTLLGEVKDRPEVLRGDKKVVYDVLKTGGRLKPSDIARRTEEASRDGVKKACQRLFEDGMIGRDPEGHYWIQRTFDFDVSESKKIVPAEASAPAQPPLGEGELEDAGAPAAVPIPEPGVDAPLGPALLPGEPEPITVAPRVVPEPSPTPSPVPLAPMPAPPVVRELSVFSLDVPAETRDLLIRAGIRTLGDAIDRELTEDLPDGLTRQQRARLGCALETAAFRNSTPSPTCSECGRDIGLDDREGRPGKCFTCQRKAAFGECDGWQAIPLGALLHVIPLRECERLERTYSIRNLGDLHEAVERGDFKSQEAERYRVIIEDARSAAVGSGSRQTIPFAPPAESQPSANGNGHAAAPVKRGRKAKVQA